MGRHKLFCGNPRTKRPVSVAWTDTRIIAKSRVGFETGNEFRLRPSEADARSVSFADRVHCFLAGSSLSADLSAKMWLHWKE